MEAENKIPRRRNPKEKASFVSNIFFLYMLPIFQCNYKKKLETEDLFEPLQCHSSKLLGEKLEAAWLKENTKHDKWALHKALFKVFGFELAITGVIRLFHELLAVSLLPLSLHNLLSYFNEKSQVTEKQAYWYASLVVSYLMADVFLNNHITWAMLHLCMKLRASCCSIIYRKSLRLSYSAFRQTTIGQIVNLLSNDVSKFNQGFHLCHYVWIAPLQAILGTYLVYRMIGISALAGVAFLIAFIPLQIYIAEKTSELSLRIADKTDERLRLMNEMLSGIQVIKMYSWEKPFAKLISLARREEIKAIRANLILEALRFSLELVLTRVSVFLTIIMFLYLGNRITADVMYPVIAIYDVLRTTLTSLFSHSISLISEVHVSILRVQKFMNNDEFLQLKLQDRSLLDDHVRSENKVDYGRAFKIPKITLNSVNAKWFLEATENTLTSINMSIEGNQFVAVIGKIGCGKSSLLNVLLKELPITKGFMEIEGNISYASQEVWLFSASIRQNILFGEAYNEDRYKRVLKTCALEDDLAALPYGDQTVIREKGKVLSGGQKSRVNLARCIYKKADIYLLDDPLSAVDAKVGKQLYEECVTKFLSNKLRVLITHQLQYLRDADKIIILNEGKIAAEGNYEELEATALDFAKLLREFNAQETARDKDPTESSDDSETERSELESTNSSEDNKESTRSGSISAGVYSAFFKAGGSYLVMILLVAVCVGAQAITSIGDYFVAQWVDMEQKVTDGIYTNETEEDDLMNKTEIILRYSAIIVAILVLQVGRAIFFFMFFIRAAVNIHDVVVTKISFATMKFFNINPIGRMLNRFSMDMGIIDGHLVFLLYNVLQNSLLFFGTIILTSTVNPLLLIPAFGIMLMFYLIRKVYIEVSRNVKRIEGTTRSPIYDHTLASINGLSTIRAVSAQHKLIKQFDNLQDVHSSAWFMYICSNRAFGFWLDLISTILIAIVTTGFVLLNRAYVGAQAGLVLTQYIGIINLLQSGLRSWCDLENNTTSVERVLEYTHVETEPVRKKPPSLPHNWPEFGKIVFNQVSMKYNSNNTPVLKSLSFTVEPLQKIGVVGRTGAGKSSTIAALFHLYDIEGCISIDGVDTKTIPLNDLRSKISIIPQEPVLFSGSVRKNLDPFDGYDNKTIWNALEQVELEELISKTPDGLSSNITEGGTNLSVGQRQLLCLARAIIRNNKILVMDEATANVDPYTDKLIQNTIKKNFADCTVITVAHRLHTVMDSDKILVMDSGKVMEFDHPYRLLQNINGLFYNMVQSLGPTIRRNLEDVAKENFIKRGNAV